MGDATVVGDDEYRRLLAVRTRLREFEHWSGEQARTQGLTPAQHQLLLAVRGHADRRGPTIGDVAKALLVHHNTAVELVDRTQQLGLLERRRDPADLRAVRLALTRTGHARLARLARSHIEELTRLAGMIDELTRELARDGTPPEQ